MLIKRSQQGRLELPAAVRALEQELLEPDPGVRGNAEQPSAGAQNARKAALFLLGVAYRAHGEQLNRQQEILAGITDAAMTALAMESVVLRTDKLASSRKSDAAADMCRVFVQKSLENVETTGRAVLAASNEGGALSANLAILARLTRFEPADTFGLRRSIAARFLEAERYLV